MLDSLLGTPDLGGSWTCLLYTSDAADERSSVDLGGRRIIKKTNTDYAEVSCQESQKEHVETNRVSAHYDTEENK